MGIRRIFGTAAVAAVLGTGLASGAAFATTEYPFEGGTWEYGTTFTHVYSNYFLASRDHKSTACSNAGCAYSGWVGPGSTSYASMFPSTFGGNEAFYDLR
ncbi:MAG: lactococcin 972 family bacteriocin [Rhodoglobus sp.]